MNSEDAEKLKALLTDPGASIDPAWIEEMKARYPFFPLPEAVSLRAKASGMTPDEREDAAAKLALSFPSCDAVERMVEPDGDRFDGLAPVDEAPATPSTNNAIDKFLATYGGADAAETEVLERMIFNPVADYAQQLARQEDAAIPDVSPTGDSRTDRINRFILSVRGMESRTGSAPCVPPVREQNAGAGNRCDVEPPQRRNQKTAPGQAPLPATDNSLLSESLAKIYIKTGRYERAYEILNRLSLAFPEKNTYFADQLRFLRKLMLAESCRKKRESDNINQE